MALFPGAVVGAQVVVVNDSITRNALPVATVRAIFSLRVQVLDGHKLTVFVLDPRDPVHTGFSKDVLGVFPYQLEAAWNRSIFSGASRGPVIVNSEAEMHRRVANTVGGVGYLSQPVAHESIRILNIEGSHP
ncbi:hypothetical protein [Ectothiorhodospira lacustris]|uniref:hypothetical protein n=1 Tax=Ectothiorhodospira lacustris TaxID=2899127 RepID=UPI001EE8B1AA|nr:hypothetical protein [Ectothiorhodospira lacustris]MCG5509073.1 hypothetical protein [Ectothiorhodospira lacustris]MCG5520864.1 hypothetical protein [Ectothiorhodospira lacustris]